MINIWFGIELNTGETKQNPNALLRTTDSNAPGTGAAVTSELHLNNPEREQKLSATIVPESKLSTLSPSGLGKSNPNVVERKVSDVMGGTVVETPSEPKSKRSVMSRAL